MVRSPLLPALLTLAALSGSAEARPVAVTASRLNVRTSPGGRVLGQIARGQQFVVRSASGSWQQIDFAGRTAWVHRYYTRSASAQVHEVTASRLNVRSRPSTRGSRIGQIKRGQRYVQLQTQGAWVLVQFDRRSGWCHSAYLSGAGTGAADVLGDLFGGDGSSSTGDASTGDSSSTASGSGGAAPGGSGSLPGSSGSAGSSLPGSSTPGSGASLPTTPPTPATARTSLADAYAGLTFSGAEIPRAGVYNTIIRRTEPYGSRDSYRTLPFVRGKTSHFGGPNDRGVTPTETGAITLENLRALNNPLNPSPSTLASRPADYYYVAMRWDYRPHGKRWWRTARILVVNPRNGKSLVVRPVDWGPHLRTRRIVDLSPQAMKDLGLTTDQDALISFAKPGTPLGPLRD